VTDNNTVLRVTISYRTTLSYHPEDCILHLKKCKTSVTILKSSFSGHNIILCDDCSNHFFFNIYQASFLTKAVIIIPCDDCSKHFMFNIYQSSFLTKAVIIILCDDCSKHFSFLTKAVTRKTSCSVSVVVVRLRSTFKYKLRNYIDFRFHQNQFRRSVYANRRPE
jgi:hypothetical protein